MKMLKVLCLTMCLFIAGMVSAFADSLTAINYSIGSNSYKLKDADITLEYGFSPFGLNVNNFWYGGDGAFHVGFDLSYGFWISTTQTYEDNTVDDWFNIGEYLSAGLGFLIDMGESNSFKLTPGVQLNIDEAFWTGSGNQTMTDFYVAFSIDFAYQHYFSDWIGLNLGFDMDFPLAGGATTKTTYNGETYSDSDDIGGGFDYRFYAGIVLR